MRRYTNEEILEMLNNLAEQLGQTSLSTKDIAKVISPSTVNNKFGNIGNALEAAGLERTAPGRNLRDIHKNNNLTNDDLFRALHQVEQKLGHEPGCNEYSAEGRYSVKPYRKRWRKWPDVLAHYRKWKSENGHILSTTSSQDVAKDDDASVDNGNRKDVATPAPALSVGTSKKKAPEQLYGEPIDFRGFRHAPINEQGVVFLFGMVSRELGFHVEAVQQGFPDCEGKYLHDAKNNLWAKARIEFEYLASNFVQHGHDANQCDFIVCWVNDWPDSLVNVIELKTEILKLPSQ